MRRRHPQLFESDLYKIYNVLQKMKKADGNWRVLWMTLPLILRSNASLGKTKVTYERLPSKLFTVNPSRAINIKNADFRQHFSELKT